MNFKIGIILPSTSRGRNWKDITESYLYTHLLHSLLITYNKEHRYVLYVVVDDDDPIYSNTQEKNKIYRFLSVMKNIEIQFITSTGIPKGHVTLMWNRAFKQAYEENCDYFFQCGDDIKFLSIGWVNQSIQKL